jgi:sugar phosphate isomerase/epimerase
VNGTTIGANQVSLAEWSLHRLIRRGELDPIDFPAFARERFGIVVVEYVNSFYADRTSDAQWVAELARRASASGVASRLIMCDGLGMVGDPDSSARAATVSAHERWMDIAAALGCMAIRVNARSEGDADEQVKLCADGLRALCDAARPRRLRVLVENHGGLSCDGEWVARLMRAVDLPECGTLPDFGNFTCADGTVADRYAGVEAMMPWAGAVSAKSGTFDSAGNESAIDYPRMVRIVRAAGYAGPIGIEYEGRGLGEVEGIEATKALLLRLGCVLSIGARPGSG